MKKSYFVRGKEIELQEVPELVAFQLSVDSRQDREAMALELGADVKEKPGWEKSHLHCSEEQRLAFEKAGWLFLTPSKTIATKVRRRGRIQGVDDFGAVYQGKNDQIQVVGDHMIVQLVPDLSEAEAAKMLLEQNFEVLSQFKFGKHLYEVRIAQDDDPFDVSKKLHAHDSFLAAEPQIVEHIPIRFTPTDPSYTQQWQWNNTGTGGATAGADISAETAWDYTRGAGIRVAVVDNGFDVTHGDLSAALTAQCGFIQNGAGGVTFNQTLAAYPNGAHGTFCAGMAAARANNLSNGCGAANQCNLTLVACLGDQVGTQATMARALAYAADPTTEVPGDNAANGADIIACSLGPNGADWIMQTVTQNAIDFAVTSGRGGLGTAIFWAVTNGDFTLDGSDGTDEVVSYGNVIAVGRSTNTDTHDGSGHGPELEFIAPGVDVVSTTSGGGITTDTGTSYAAPCAAGVGALVLAMDPALTWTQLRQVMRDTCDKVGGVAYDASGHHDRYGFGRVNAARAVCQAGIVVTLDTVSLTFNDIPELETTVRAAVFR